MAKDDYHVIVYQILAYLYQRLKKGEVIDSKFLECDSPILSINKRYWLYVIWNMFNDGLIDGLSFIEMDGVDYPYPVELDKCMITPHGIDYLCNNSLMNKVISFLKDTKDIVPFI